MKFAPSLTLRVRSDEGGVAGGRLLGAAIALLLGVAFSFAMYSWQTPYGQQPPYQTKDWLWSSIPFAGLAALIVGGLRRSAAALGWIVLAALTSLAYAASANLWWLKTGSYLDTATIPLWLQFFWGMIVLGNLVRFRERRSRPAEAEAPTIPAATTVRRLGIILLASTAIAFSPILPWTHATGRVLAFCLAAVCPLCLSSGFALVQFARGRESKTAAKAWLGATLLVLLGVFMAVAASHLTFPTIE